MKCASPVCDRDAVAQGLCQAHYMRKRRGAKVKVPIGHRDVDATEHIQTKVSKEVADALAREAWRRKTSVYEVARGVLERWAARQR